MATKTGGISTMDHVKSITVVGGGTAGWMSASYFVKQGFLVNLIESPVIPNIGVGESCLPALSFFCEQLGLKDEEWMPESNAVYKLGIYHYNWLRHGSTWKHWFCYDRNKADSEWYLDNGRIPPRELRRHSYHIDAIAFGQMLKNRVALPSGVNHIQAHITDVFLDDKGYISSLVLDKGKTVSSDFYIDCSGPAKLLANKIGIKFKTYGDIPNDRAIACPQKLEVLGPPKYTITYAESNGWLWNTALAHRRGCGYTYSSSFTTDDEALTTYLMYNPDTDMDKLRVLKFDSQYAVNPLEKNVLAVGLASGFIEPLEATSIYLVQYYIETFGKIVNTGRNPQVYNKAVHRITKELYEFVLTSYTLTQRDDTEYWKYWREMENKLDTKSMVLDRANQPDSGTWSISKVFAPFNWWSKAQHFELI